MPDSLAFSTILALGALLGFCAWMQLRLRRRWLALSLSCLLAPVLFHLGEPLLYSPKNFVLLILPRLPTFLWNGVQIYPALFLTLWPVPVLAAVLWGRRAVPLTSMELT
jgi:hypothetical protein